MIEQFYLIMNGTLASTTTPGLKDPCSNDDEKVLSIPQCTRIRASTSHTQKLTYTHIYIKDGK